MIGGNSENSGFTPSSQDLARSKDADRDGPRDRTRGELGSQHVSCGRHRVDWISPGSRNCTNVGNGDTLRVHTRPGQNGRLPSMNRKSVCSEDGYAARAGRRGRHRVPLASRQKKDQARKTAQRYSSQEV